MNNDTSDMETENQSVQVTETKDTSEAKTVKKKRASKKKVDSNGAEVQKKSRKKTVAAETLEKFEVVCDKVVDPVEVDQSSFVAEVDVPVYVAETPFDLGAGGDTPAVVCSTAREDLEKFHGLDIDTEIAAIKANPNNVPEPEVLEQIELEEEPPAPVLQKPSRKKGSVFDIVRWRRRGR